MNFVYGNFQKKNIGDDRIQFSWEQLLSGKSTTFLPHYQAPRRQWGWTRSWHIIGGGGLVFEAVGVWDNGGKWTQQKSRKIGAAGLGINRMDESLAKTVRTIADRSEFFFVRGQRSLDLCLEAQISASLGTDMTWSVPFEAQDSFENGVACVSLVPCWWKNFSEKNWKKVLHSLSLDYISLPMDPRDEPVLQNCLSLDNPPSFAIESLQKAVMLIGARFHSVVFAMQMGIPVIAIEYDFKVGQLMKEVGLEEFSISIEEPDRLPGLVEKLRSERETICDKIRAYADCQKACAVEMIAEVKNGMEQTL